MTTQPNPGRITTGPNGQPVIAGPWPSYKQFRDWPERKRWELYGSAKAYRAALEDQGIAMAEPYDTFIRRVCEELNV